MPYLKKKNQTPILSNIQAGSDLKDFLISWVSFFFFFLTELQMFGGPSLSLSFWEPEAGNTVLLLPDS